MELNLSFNQKLHYQNCGIKCLNLLFQYYRIDKTSEDLIKEDLIKKDVNKHLWISDLGIMALKIGLKATLYTYSQKIFRPEWFNFSKQKLLKCLQEKRGNLLVNHARKSVLEFLKLNGKLSFKILNAKALKSYIKNRKPVLLAVSSNILHHQSMLGGHFVVLIGYSKDHFIILNPGREKIKKKRIDIDLLLYAFYQWGAWAIVLS